MTWRDRAVEKAGTDGVSMLAQRAKAESWSQWSLTHGMQTLPEALQEVLRGHERVEIHHSAPVRTLSYTAGGWEVRRHAVEHCRETELKGNETQHV